MKTLTSILCLFLFGLQLSNAQSQVMILDVDGKVKIKTAEGKCINAAPGAVYNPESMVFPKANSSLLVLTENQFIKIEGTGEQSIKGKDLNTRSRDLGFDALFVEFLKSSYSIMNNSITEGDWSVKSSKSRGDGWGATNPKTKSGWGATNPKSKKAWGATSPPSKSGWGVTKPPKKNAWGVTNPKKKNAWGATNPKSKAGWGATDPRRKGAWGATGPKSKAGWTEEDMTIEPAVPGGYYKTEKADFKWIRQSGVPQYLICIMDEDLNLLHSEISKTDAASIDLSICEPGKSYYWQVFADGVKAISPPITFNIIDPSDLSEIMDFHVDSDIYKNASPAIKGTMEAVALEYSNMYLNTYLKYGELMSKYPKNRLVKMNYAAFCARMGQGANAKEIAEKM